MPANRTLPLLQLCAALAIGCGAAAGIVPAFAEAPGKTEAIVNRSAMSMLDPIGSFAPMLERVIPSVVSVLVTGETLEPVTLSPRTGDGALPPLPAPSKRPFRSGGSGVVIDAARGLILTNNHVIENAIRIEVSLSDGRHMPAKLIGTDVGTDVAIIAVEDRALPALTIGDSDRVRVGDVVLAVGNPFGLEGTATLGIVSAKMRTEIGHGAFEDFMQVDAPINPGNSGGALVNVHGELVGINTAGPRSGSQASGIGFAIPINMAQTILAELVAHGRMRRGSPGILAEDLTHELMQRLHISLNRGARITEIVPGSSAEAARIKPGGIVTAISGKPVRSAIELATRVATVPAGTTLAVTINSDGRDSVHQLVASEIRLTPQATTLSAELGGIAGAEVADIVLGDPLFGNLRGARVTRVPAGSPAWRTGLVEGDVIVGVDEGDVRMAEDIARLVRRTGMLYRLTIRRQSVPAWVRVVR